MTPKEQIDRLYQIGIHPKGVEVLEQVVEKVSQLKFDNIYLVYKFIETPLQVISSGLCKLSEEDRKNYYKNVARFIHPDKNWHPQAKEAFQKLRAALANFSNM